MQTLRKNRANSASASSLRVPRPSSGPQLPQLLSQLLDLTRLPKGVRRSVDKTGFTMALFIANLAFSKSLIDGPN